MTTANKITILRILLIPFFVVEMIYYVRTGNETFRLAGLLSFAVAAILTAWTATSRAATTSGASWAQFSTRSRTSCCWFPPSWS